MKNKWFISKVSFYSEVSLKNLSDTHIIIMYYMSYNITSVTPIYFRVFSLSVYYRENNLGTHAQSWDISLINQVIKFIWWKEFWKQIWFYLWVSEYQRIPGFNLSRGLTLGIREFSYEEFKKNLKKKKKNSVSCWYGKGIILMM